VKPETGFTRSYRESEFNLQRILNLAWSLVVRYLPEGLVAFVGKAPAHPIRDSIGTMTGEIARIRCREKAGAREGVVDQVVIHTGNVFGIVAELHLVEEVEKLHSELEGDLLAHFEILVN